MPLRGPRLRVAIRTEYSQGHQREMYEAKLVGEIEAGESAKIKERLEGLIETWNRSTFDIADLLYLVKSKRYYRAYGYETFTEYIKELDIKTRKAHYLARMVDIMEQLDIPRKDYEPVGVAKLREITSLDVTDENGEDIYFDDPKTGESHLMGDVIRGLLPKALNMSVQEVKDYVKTLKGFSGDNELAWLNIQVNKQALDETIRPALELAKKHLGDAGRDEDGTAKDPSDGRALEIISVEFINNPANTVLGEYEHK